MHEEQSCCNFMGCFSSQKSSTILRENQTYISGVKLENHKRDLKQNRLRLQCPEASDISKLIFYIIDCLKISNSSAKSISIIALIYIEKLIL
mgnify:CR=1 FL=1